MPVQLERRSLTHSEETILQHVALQPFIANRVVVAAAGSSWLNKENPQEEAEVLLCYRQLQDIADYRKAVRAWFAQTKIGGHLILVVPHAFLYDRRFALPSRLRPQQRRLYSPGSLLNEVEEALIPNTYRIRLVRDLDDGYDYAAVPASDNRDGSDIAVVLERIQPPSWLVADHAIPVSQETLDRKPGRFEPERTRIEQDRRVPARRILIMKLDHLGDLVMGLPALRRAREYFADARIDLVVGSWNESMARDFGVADHVIAFDAFPRNSSEEEPNVDTTVGLFRSLLTDEYDLAIDLRADIDTRILLRAVKAPLKAGIGTRGRFPFLDIALPVDNTRNHAERANSERIRSSQFAHQGSARRTHFALHSDKATVEREYAIFWGPYLALDVGEYIFDFFIDLEAMFGGGLLHLDIALDRGTRVAEMFVSGPGSYQLSFRVDKPGTIFEARVFAVDDHPSISFSFYGGLLIKRSPGNVLHQSEYAMLLIELVRMRVLELGVAQEVMPR